MFFKKDKPNKYIEYENNLAKQGENIFNTVKDAFNSFFKKGDKLDKKAKKNLVTILVLMIAIPFFFFSYAFADGKCFCTECGVELGLDGPTYTHTSYASDCSHAGETFSKDDALPSWVTHTDPETGEDTEATAKEEEDSKKPLGQGFIEMMIDVVFDTGSGEGYLSPTSLLENTFGYAVGVIEGTDKIDFDYGDFSYEGVVNSDWYKYFLAIAIALMILRFAIEMSGTNIFNYEDMTFEKNIKPWLKLVFGIFFIAFAHYLFSFAMWASQAAFGAMNNVINDTGAGSIVDDMKSKIPDMLGFEKGGITKVPGNIGALVQGVILLLLPYLVSVISTVAVFFVCFKRVLEMVVRIALSPFCLTDVYKGADRSHAMNYLFKFFGLCFQSVAILVVLWVSSILCSLMFTSIFGSNTGLSGLKDMSTMATTMAAIKLAQMALLLGSAKLSEAAFTN